MAKGVPVFVLLCREHAAPQETTSGSGVCATICHRGSLERRSVQIEKDCRGRVGARVFRGRGSICSVRKMPRTTYARSSELLAPGFARGVQAEVERENHDEVDQSPGPGVFSGQYKSPTTDLVQTGLIDLTGSPSFARVRVLAEWTCSMHKEAYACTRRAACSLA